MSACSRLVTRNGRTKSMTGSIGLAFRHQIRAHLARPRGVTDLDNLPPQSALHLLVILSSVDETDIHASKIGAYASRRLVSKIMNEPSPSKIPASHAASVGIMCDFTAANPKYHAIGRERLANVAPLLATEVSA